MSIDDTERELLIQAISGDRVALGRLLLSHTRRLKRHLSPQIPDLLSRFVSVDDIVQETFIQAFRDVRQFQPRSDGSFSAWLKAIADNRLRDTIEAIGRKKRGGDFHQAQARSDSLTRLAELLSDHGDTPSRPVVRREIIDAVQLGLASLPEDQRVAISLRYLDGKTTHETASAMNRSPDAVRGLVHRAKQALREALGTSSRWFYRK